jgi:hypothetical protein
VTRDDRLLRLSELMRQRECAIWASADLSLYLSDEEAQIASALQPQATIGAIVPYCFDRFSQQRSAQPGREIIFVAGFGHPPNENAACWFVSEVFPLIAAECPDAHLSIIGSAPSERVRALAGPKVRVYAPTSPLWTSQRPTGGPGSRWCRCALAPA